MKRLIPDWTELAIFAVLALICAAVAAPTKGQDLRLSALAIPLFIFAAILGLRRNGQLYMTEPPRPVATEKTEQSA